MARQSTRYVLLIEPAAFGYNPETASTNDYQVDARESGDTVFKRALAEFRKFRDTLVEAGIGVTTMRGAPNCPDAIFPNWMSTHEDGSAYLYPMMAPNRRRERTEDISAFFRNYYNVKEEFVPYELENKPLESTGSMVLDRVNHIAYIGRSLRTNEEVAREWCRVNSYETVVFDTVDHRGNPVYHSDLVIWIGTEMAGCGSQMIAEADRARVLASLAAHREVLELENAQIRSFCGNAIELRGAGDQPMLIMSEAAYGMLTSDQLSRINRYFTRIVTSAIPTIETYGGGSARCMVQELF